MARRCSIHTGECCPQCCKILREDEDKIPQPCEGLGKNRAIVAIARILMETIYTMLSRGTEFTDRIDPLTERKMGAMRSRAVKPSQIQEWKIE